MEAFKPFVVWLVILFVVGAFLNIFIAPFIDLGSSISSDSLSDLNSTLSNESNMFTSTSSNFVVEQVELFSILPDYITFPFFIIGIVLLLLTILNLIPFVG